MSLQQDKQLKIIKIPLPEKDKPKDYPQNFSRMPTLYLELFENKAKIKQDLINKNYIPPKTETKEREIKENKENKQIKEKEPKTTLNENTEIKEKISDSISVSDSNSKSDSISSSDSSSESDSNSKSSRSVSSSDTDSKDSDDLSVRLKELLGDGTSSESEKSEKYSKKHSKSIQSKSSYDKYKQDIKPLAPAPTLAELEAKGYYQKKAELRDINHITVSEHEQEDKKRELLFKFDLLRKSYPLGGPTIPEFTIHSDLYEMQKSYDSTVRRLSLDSTVESYKTYLTGGFMLTEFIFGHFLGFDMQGFTQQQIVNMHQYEKLLIELGEKSYVPSGSRWPVELRLLFIVIINAGLFIVGKMIFRKTGANLMSMVNSMNSQQNQPPPKPKRKMRGPEIDLDEIPELEKTEKQTK